MSSAPVNRTRIPRDRGLASDADAQVRTGSGFRPENEVLPRCSRYSAHPAGTGPIRLRAMVPELPLELPPVKLKLNVAVEQLRKASVPVPTLVLVGAGPVGLSNTPPTVS